MEMTYMNYKIDNEHHEIYFLRGMVNYLKSHPEEKIWVDNFLEKKQGYRLNYYSQNTFDSVPHLRKMHTMTIRKPETSFHADGNKDVAKIRRELKLGCGYAYVMVFEGLCPLFYFDWLVVTNRPVKLVLANPADK